MQPGIPRAVIGSILGFIAGFAIVVALRIMFGFEPYWKLGLGIVLATFTCAFGFIWGMGAFDAKMSAHPDDSVPQPTLEEQALQAGPLGILTNTTWSIAFWTLLVVLGVFALAQIPGLGLSITRVPNASVGAIGSYTVQVFGGEIVVNQLLVLAGFIAFTMFSLFLAAGVIGFLLTFLNREVEVARKTPNVDFSKPAENTPALLQRMASLAGNLAERIDTKPDTTTTAVVKKEDN